MTNDLIGFGNDITKVRAQIPENLEVIYTPVFHKDIATLLSTLSVEEMGITLEELEKVFPILNQPGIKHLPKEMGVSQKDIQEKFLSLCGIEFTFDIDNPADLLKVAFILGLRNIKENPFRVNYLYAWMIELIYILENQGHDSPKHLRTLTKLVNRKHSLTLASMLNNPNRKLGLIDYFKQFREEDPSTENYPRIFAFTLRQTTAQKVDFFLEEKRQSFSGNFLDFLEVLLIDFKDLIPGKISELAQRWLENQEEEANTLTEGKMVDDEEPSLPPGYVKIEGRLSTEEIRRFFSFLYQETNGCSSKEPFLSKEEVEELLRYGFSYPEEEQVKKPFELQLNEKKPQRIIYYALFLLMQKHKDVWAPHKYKSHYALFLKHNFRNFEGISEEAIRKDIRGRYPKRMERGFDLNKYLP